MDDYGNQGAAHAFLPFRSGFTLRASSAASRASSAAAACAARAACGTPPTPSPFAVVDRRIARDERIRRRPNSVMPVCPAAPSPIADRQVAADADLAAEHHAVADHGAAGDADLRRQQHVAADHHAVRRSARGCRSSCRALIRVSPTAGRSIVVFAPISTSSSITTGATCGIFSCVPSARCAKPKPSLPTTAPFWMTTRSPIVHALADRDVRVQHAVGADDRAVADHHVRDARWCERRSARRCRSRRTRRSSRRIDLRRRRDRASGGHPPAAAVGISSRAARANVRYGDSLRITARRARDDRRVHDHGAGACVGQLRRIFGLARNVRSPGPASSIVATRRISMAPSPSTGSPSAARSPSVTRSRISRRSAPSARRTRQCSQPQALGDALISR